VEVIFYPISPGTVEVLGSRWKADEPAWSGLAFSHPETSVMTQSTLFLMLVGPKKAPYDLHLRVPFEHPDDGPIPDPPDMYYRVRPRAEVGRRWLGRKVVAVDIEAAPDMDPPWRIKVTFAGNAKSTPPRRLERNGP
jgi:hypothetical protein